jgi:V8-like Glu-specific endopeptidase
MSERASTPTAKTRFEIKNGAPLRDVPARLEVEIGADDRTRVSSTANSPWRWICHLAITARNGATFLGTGFLIGPRTVATAGHCVHMPGQGDWVEQVVVTPGRDASARPFGAVVSTVFRAAAGWMDGGDRGNDYGAVFLPEGFDAAPSGACDLDALDDAALHGARLNLAGYPGDKPSGTLWYQGRRAAALDPGTILYSGGAAGGTSGAPVWLAKGGTRVVVGIHAGGDGSAVRVTRPVLDDFLAWRRQTG